jgi:hypothetical protein
MKKYVLAVICLSLVSATMIKAQDESSVQLADVGTYSTDARTARIALLRSKYKIIINATEKQQLALNCTGAQNNLRKIQTTLPSIITTRLTSYDSVINELVSLRARLNSGLVDVSGLDLLIVDYQQKRTLFSSAGDGYMTALQDSVLVDCKSNPEDFRASVEGVREARRNLVSAAKDVRETTDSTLKTTLDSLSIKLRKQDAQ